MMCLFRKRERRARKTRDGAEYGGDDAANDFF
jgi:hypothetical protein